MHGNNDELILASTAMRLVGILFFFYFNVETAPKNQTAQSHAPSGAQWQNSWRWWRTTQEYCCMVKLALGSMVPPSKRYSRLLEHSHFENYNFPLSLYFSWLVRCPMVSWKVSWKSRQVKCVHLKTDQNSIKYVCLDTMHGHQDQIIEAYYLYSFYKSYTLRLHGHMHSASVLWNYALGLLTWPARCSPLQWDSTACTRLCATWMWGRIGVLFKC